MVVPTVRYSSRVSTVFGTHEQETLAGKSRNRWNYCHTKHERIMSHSHLIVSEQWALNATFICRSTEVWIQRHLTNCEDWC